MAEDVLPDISLLPSYLASAYVTTSNSELPAGTRALRFDTASVNYGPGRFELVGGQVIGSTQLVNQRVFRTDGTNYLRPAGTMTYHPAHGHIHFDDWTQFRLKVMTPTGGVGNVVAVGEKTSFCILELVNWDPSAPGHNTAPGYSSCGQFQGLRAGWGDVYGATLAGQYINLTGVPDGIYWLEGEVDPNNGVLELSDNNNIVRIPVAIGNPPATTPDAYEDNDTLAVVNAAVEGGTNSPNLGLVQVDKVVRNLSMEDSADFYRFRIHAGQSGAYLKMESPWLRQSNLNLTLHNSAGTQIAASSNGYSWEQISLAGLAAGTYYAKVVRGDTSTTNPNYTLSIIPTPNNPPFFEMDEPGPGDQWVERAHHTFFAQWNGNDPDNDPKLVSLLRSRDQVLGPHNEPIPGYENIPNPNGSANINTADFGYGKWYILGIGTDGASQTISWAPGAIWIYKMGDINYDGRITYQDDYLPVLHEWKIGRGLHHPWNIICDMNEDEQITVVDIKLLSQEIEP